MADAVRDEPAATGISAPQNKPMTLGYTKMGSLENYEYFFGAPVSPEKIKDYTEHHALTYHFPDAYAGSNTKIRDTLNNLILKVLLRRGVLVVSVAAPLLAVSTFVRCALRSRRSRGKPRSGSPSSSSRERCARVPRSGAFAHTALRASLQDTSSPHQHGVLLCWWLQVVEWDEISFDVRLLQRVPVRGPDATCTPPPPPSPPRTDTRLTRTH